VHITSEDLKSGYKGNKVLATQIFAERKRDMIVLGNSFIKPGDKNSKYYTKPDEDESLLDGQSPTSPTSPKGKALFKVYK